MAPSPVVNYVAPPSAATGVFTDFENPQFSVLAVEPAASQVVDSFSSGVERVHRGLVNPQISIFAVEASTSKVHQEQISAEQFVESVKEFPQ